MLSDEDMRRRMVNGWRGGLSQGTSCGPASTHRNTSRIRDWLPELCQTYDIHTVCDAGAGDLHWVQDVEWDVEYRAFDLLPWHPEVTELDITTEALPECDLILCRMVLNHIGNARTDMAIELFKQSGRWLLATHFVNGGPKNAREFTRLDICERLGDPVDMCRDGHEDNCYLALWKL